MAKKKSKLRQLDYEQSDRKTSRSKKKKRVTEMTDADVLEAEETRQGGNTQSCIATQEAKEYEENPDYFKSREKLQSQLHTLSCVINPITGELECSSSRAHAAENEFTPSAGTDPWGNLYSNARSFMGVASSGIDPFGNLYGSYLTEEEDELSESFDPRNYGERVLGTAIGYRTRHGVPTGEVALKVYIDRKAMRASSLTSKRVPSEIDGMPVDVEEVGGDIVPVAGFQQSYPRPVPSGVSICNIDADFRLKQRSAGTLGCLVELDDGRLCVLSNHHVLSPGGTAQEGDRVIQPGSLDGGTKEKLIGLYTDFRNGGPAFSTGGNEAYQVDADVAFTNFDLVSPKHVNYEIDPEPVLPKLGMTVVKNGRTTGATMGVITGIGLRTSIMYPGSGLVSFTGQIMIQGLGNNAFSMAGDSGSLITCAMTKRPVALLFAGSTANSYTLANPIHAVMREVGIKRFVS
ncbi:MAG: S1 family peptidase [Planctomycetes bacterium]|nr:S1 family peptidase [Planctomycetota bacterium]MCH9723312.1 S1 family peptidase [Planctomycetota bacterium]MCH9779113.1 S1 family peptidase [Planctomycetota bacterium]MCH9789179.1 S1 family peptidase [Planctomycetota bacterium]